MANTQQSTANQSADKDKHLITAKERARAAFRRGEWHEALIGFLSDLEQHPEWSNRTWTARANREYLYSRNAATVNKIIEMLK